MSCLNGTTEMSFENIPYTIQTCDGGSHRRKDRLNGGLYITKGVVSMALSTMQPQETIVVKKKRNHRRQTATYCLDCQGGMGSANFQTDVCATILSDSHGTPHAIVQNFLGCRNICP